MDTDEKSRNWSGSKMHLFWKAYQVSGQSRLCFGGFLSLHKNVQIMTPDFSVSVRVGKTLLRGSMAGRYNYNHWHHTSQGRAGVKRILWLDAIQHEVPSCLGDRI